MFTLGIYEFSTLDSSSRINPVRFVFSSFVVQFSRSIRFPLSRTALLLYHIILLLSSTFLYFFNINFVSPYILAQTLLPKIKARGGRLVAVGSIAHNYSKIDPSDIDFSTRKASSKVYGNAKRYLMYSLWGLDEYEGVISVTHPGIAVTNITAHYPKLLYAIIKYPMKIIFMNPKKASLCILSGIFKTTEKNEWIGPRLFDVWGLPKKKKIKTCSKEEAEKISNTAKEIYLK